MNHPDCPHLMMAKIVRWSGKTPPSSFLLLRGERKERRALPEPLSRTLGLLCAGRFLLHRPLDHSVSLPAASQAEESLSMTASTLATDPFQGAFLCLTIGERVDESRGKGRKGDSSVPCGAPKGPSSNSLGGFAHAAITVSRTPPH